MSGKKDIYQLRTQGKKEIACISLQLLETDVKGFPGLSVFQKFTDASDYFESLAQGISCFLSYEL